MPQKGVSSQDSPTLKMRHWVAAKHVPLKSEFRMGLNSERIRLMFSLGFHFPSFFFSFIKDRIGFSCVLERVRNVAHVAQFKGLVLSPLSVD